MRGAGARAVVLSVTANATARARRPCVMRVTHENTTTGFCPAAVSIHLRRRDRPRDATASSSGGEPRRLTATPGVEIDPYFSPDGSQIAFTATVAGNTDVYVAPAAGGDPKRLTYHPGADRVRGWTPDGRRVVFASARASAPQQSYFRLWTIGLEGGLPEQLPMPRAFTGVYSPDGRRLAYEEVSTAFIPEWYETSQWRHYRGGRTHPIRIMTLADYSVEKLPWSNSNDTHPMWVGDTVYFLSDRNHTVNLFAYRGR